MYAVIETNGANKIVIGIPREGAEKSLPALAAMLEKNAVFIQQGWREAKIVEPQMSITLGDSYKAENDDNPVIVALPSDASVIDEGFEVATPDVFTSNAKAIAAVRAEVQQKNEKIQSLEVQLREANSEVLRLRAQLALAEEGTDD